MKGNEEKEWMENLEVKTILTSKFQMMSKSLNNNYRNEDCYFIMKWTMSTKWGICDIEI
jgi:hypothetical protein